MNETIEGYTRQVRATLEARLGTGPHTMPVLARFWRRRRWRMACWVRHWMGEAA